MGATRPLIVLQLKELLFGARQVYVCERHGHAAQPGTSGWGGARGIWQQLEAILVAKHAHARFEQAYLVVLMMSKNVQARRQTTARALRSEPTIAVLLAITDKTPVHVTAAVKTKSCLVLLHFTALYISTPA